MNRARRIRWLRLRVTLFFVAAMVWLVGVVIDVAWVRWVAIGAAFGALILGLIARRSGPSEPSFERDE